jgi:hypothetical protein
LVKQVLAAGDQALASGDAQTARTHFTTVLRCAQSLSQPERLTLIRTAAKAAHEAAQTKLQSLPATQQE